MLLQFSCLASDSCRCFGVDSYISSSSPVSATSSFYFFSGWWRSTRRCVTPPPAVHLFIMNRELHPWAESILTSCITVWAWLYVHCTCFKQLPDPDGGPLSSLVWSQHKFAHASLAGGLYYYNQQTVCTLYWMSQVWLNCTKTEVSLLFW